MEFVFYDNYLVIGTQSIMTGWNIDKIQIKSSTQWSIPSTFLVAKLATDATPKIFHISEPITAPNPMSESAIKVLIKFVNNSGIAVADAIKTAAPTSWDSVKKNEEHYGKQISLRLKELAVVIALTMNSSQVVIQGS